MDIKFVIAIVSALFCFLGSFFSMSFFLKPNLSKHPVASIPALWLFLPSIVCILILSLIIPDFHDFIYEPNILSIIIPIFCILGLFALSASKTNPKYISVAILLSCSISAFTLPFDSLIFQIDNLSLIIDRLLLICFWFSFSYLYYIISGINGVQPIQSLGICLGFFILSIIGGTPFFYGLIALCIFSSTLNHCIFNWYPARFSLDKSSSQICGFILGWLLAINSSEGLFPQSVILTSFLWVEICYALSKKITLRNKFSDLITNTICYQTNVSGLSPNNISALISKLILLLVIFSLFQLYAPNLYSLPILSIITTFWFMYKIKNWQNPQPTLKEINQKFVNDLHQGIKNLKNINKD